MTDAGIAIVGTYDLRLVVLSVVIAVIAAYTALDLAGWVTVTQGQGRKFWLAGGAIALGTGIWAMHFIGMLAYQLPIPMTYDLPLVLVSITVAIAASGIALFVVSRSQITGWQLLIGGIFMGIGIAAMHYIGMAGLQMHATSQYNLKLVAVSVAIAISASLVALYLAFQLRTETTRSSKLLKLYSALLLGTAIAGMHYTAMSAVQFQPISPVVPQPLQGIDNAWLAVGIGLATLIILALPLLASLVVQRMRAEGARAEALKQSEERFRALVQNASDVIAVLSADGIITYQSPSIQLVLGYEVEEWLGQLAAKLVHPEDLPRTKHLFSKSLAAPALNIAADVRLRHADETWRDCEVIMNNLLTELSVAGIVITYRDITARKRAEAEQRFLAEASTLLGTSLNYQTTLENLAQLAVPQLADWCAVDVLEADQTIRSLAVVHQQPSKVQLAQELRVLYPPDLQQPHGVPKVLSTGQSELYPEISDSLLQAIAHDDEHLRRLQEIGFTSAMIVPLIARGRTLGAITFVTAESGRSYDPATLTFAEELARRAALAVDNARLFETVQTELTERQRAEAELQNRADELTRTTTILARTAAILEKRNQELDQFAYIASHDLKAPLRAIATLSQWLEEDLSDKLTEETQQQMNLLRGRVHRMEALINGILQYSRIGRVKTESAVVSVKALLADIIDSLAPPPEFTITVESEMPTFLTQRLLLEQVFANLISNGIKHHDRHNGQIQISVQDQGEFFEFAVADDGPGIEPQYHQKIFTIFQTLQARDQVENTGIGLSLVKKIVESQGGIVRLNSQEGQGATFRFTWPKSVPETT